MNNINRVIQHKIRMLLNSISVDLYWKKLVLKHNIKIILKHILFLSSASNNANSFLCFSIKFASLYNHSALCWPLNFLQGPLSNAFLAASTALSTSSIPASSTSAIVSSVWGLIVSNLLPLADFSHFPPINSFVCFGFNNAFEKISKGFMRAVHSIHLQFYILNKNIKFKCLWLINKINVNCK